MACLKTFYRFCKTFCHIKWTTTTLVICALPFILTFIITNFIVLIVDGNTGAIITRTRECGVVGEDIFKEGGSAADVVIAMMFCENVHLPLKVGIGGGFSATMLMNGRFNSLIATPVDPSNISAILRTQDNPLGTQTGGVPGELLGYWEMHQKYGLLPWKKLLEPAIKMCYETNPLNGYMLNDLQKILNYSLTWDLLTYIVKREYNETVMPVPVFAATLMEIAEKGANAFYNGEIGKAFIEELQEAGGFMTFDDLKNYRVSWSSELVTFSLPNGLRGYTTPLPSSGAMVALVMNTIKPYVDVELPVFWHRVVEAMKHAYGISRSLGDLETESIPEHANIIRETYKKMIDPDFARSLRDKIFDDRIFNDSAYYGVKYRPKYEGGSVEMCVIAPNGDAISLISSLIWPVGKFFWSSKTGIVLNNQLLRPAYGPANLPLAPGNYLEPGKRFKNSHAPVIVINTRTYKPYFVVSAAGGGYIPSEVTTAIINYCLFRKDAYAAINSGFFRPRFTKNVVEYGDDVANDVVEYIEKVGNKVTCFEEDLKRCSTSCIGNYHSFPMPRMSRKHKDYGSATIRPDLMMKVLYLMVIIFMCLGVISIVSFEYCEYISHQNYDVNV